MNEANQQSMEINKIIEMARTAFLKMKNLLVQKSHNLELIIRMVRCYMCIYTFPIQLYGVEAWTFKKADIKELDAFELWTYV